MTSELSIFAEHLIVGLAGPELLAAEKQLLKTLRPLGIILFAKNFDAADPGWRKKHFALLDQVHDLTGRPDLLVSIDHEGGRVHRFPAPVTRFPAAKRWREHARAVGEAMAAELASLGFNLTFAPVLDVHSEPSNPVIGERALADNPDDAARFAVEFLAGITAMGLLGCGKHFPGHGATTQDSHHELPRLGAPLSLLRERELKPFAALVQSDIPLIMTAHVVYPELDEQYPATLSRRISTELLRGELSFQGALITDDLEMKALGHLSAEEKGVAALRAGSDILLEANPQDAPALEVAERMLRGVAKEADAGRLDLSRSRERLARLVERSRELAPQREANLGHEQLLGAPQHASLKTMIEQIG